MGSSAQGRIDEEGRFFPSADLLVSAQSGFVFYVAVPRGPTGRSGPSGPNGHVSFERGDVRSHFEGLGAIVEL